MPIGSIATFEARSIAHGGAVQNQGALSKFKQIFSTKDQLCVYNPATHQHIASGIKRGDLGRLIQLNPDRQMGGAELQTAGRILDAAGINHANLGPADKIKLAIMATTDPERAIDTARLAQANIHPSTMMSPEFVHNLANLVQNHPPLAQQLANVHTTSQGSSVATQNVIKIAELAQHSPNLATKLGTLAHNEITTGAHPGLTNYMTERAIEDPFMHDHASHLDPATLPTTATLGFEPKFHVKLDAATFASVSSALGRLQADGVFTDMNLDAATNTIHCGYSYQALSDIGAGLDGNLRADGTTIPQADANTVKSAFRSAAYAKLGPTADNALSLGLILEKSFGNPGKIAERQQTRYDAVLEMFTNYESFDYTAFDAGFTPGTMDRLDHAFTGQNDQQRITQLLTTEGLDGFAIGEDHSDTSSKRFIFDNLANLYNSGVRVLAIEHLKDAEFQSLIDDYMATPSGTAMNADLVAALKTIDRGHAGSESLTGIVQKIHDDPLCRGIRLIGADTENNNPSKDAVHKYEVRMGAMNTVAEKLLRAELQPGEKFVILAGAAHNNTHVGLTHGMPGFSQALGIAAIKVTANGPGFNMAIDREDLTKRTAATLARPQ
jgi:RTX toxin RtxA